jgi:hypothetical protein
MNFEEWLKGEIEKLDKIKDVLKEKYGNVDRDYQEWLFEDAKEPWGFVQKGSVTHAAANQKDKDEEKSTSASGKAAAMDNGIVAIMAKWDLVDDNGKLKAKKYIQPDNFAILAGELEEHGYKYSKSAGGFILPPKGVKQ